MFDTIAQNRIAQASLSSPCQGLGGCNNHRARAEQQEAIERSLPAQIANVLNQFSTLKNGAQQKEYDLLREKQTKLEQ